MKRCVECGGKLERTTTRIVITAAGHKFTATLPARKCAACGETYTSAPDHMGAELAAAAMLARSGEASGETFRFMRHVLGLRGADVGALLGVTFETVSRWESGTRAVDRLAWAALASVVIARAEGEARTTEAVLGAIATPKPLAKTVKLATSAARDRGAAE